MRVELTVPVRLILEVTVLPNARGVVTNLIDVCREDHATLPHAEAPDPVAEWVTARFATEIQRAGKEAVQKLTEEPQ